MEFIKNFYNYLFYLWYRFANKCGEKSAQYYVCFILSVIETISISVFMKILMNNSILKISIEQNDVLFILWVGIAIVLMMLHGIYFIRNGKFLEIVDYYENEGKISKSNITIHTIIIVCVAIVFFYAAYFIPISYVD